MARRNLTRRAQAELDSQAASRATDASAEERAGVHPQPAR